MILYTDLDGTCITDWDKGPSIPAANLKAIRRFTANGGLFSVATGRQISEVLAVFPDDTINFPIVCANGAAIYDPVNTGFLRRIYLSREYKIECMAYCKAHPELSISAADDIYNYRVDTANGRHKPNPNAKAVISPEMFIDGDYVKMAFKVPDPQNMDALEDEVLKFSFVQDVTVARSSGVYLDVVDKKVNKAEGVSFCASSVSGEKRKLVCIGDYYNDLQMLLRADIAACPSGSPEDIKAVCDFISCDNDRGAVGRLIDWLMETPGT